MDANPAKLDRMARLSRRYARYSHSQPGLSLALGAATMFFFLLAPPVLINHTEICRENGFSLLALTVAALLCGWVLLKEWLRERIYQSMGFVQASESVIGPILIHIVAAGLVILSLSYPVRALAALPHPDPAPTAYQIWIGLAACFALPWITLRFIRGIQECLLWVLLSFFALEFVWGLPDMNFNSAHAHAMAYFIMFSFLLVCFGGLIAGLVQHFNFLRLAREIRALESGDE